MNKKHEIALVMGDPYNDGHGKSETVNIVSNLSAKEIIKAYTKGSKKIGFNYIHDYCHEYEDSYLPASIADTLVKAGFHQYIFDDLDFDEENDQYSISYDIHYQIYLFIVYLGDNLFVHEIRNDSQINIGGYGFGL